MQPASTSRLPNLISKEVYDMTQPYYEFFCPVKVIAGLAALEHIPFELAILGAKRAMLITDKGVRSNQLLTPIEAAFAASNACPTEKTSVQLVRIPFPEK